MIMAALPTTPIVSSRPAASIVQFWADGDPPAPLAVRMQGWRQLNPEWSYACYSRRGAESFLREAFEPALAEAFLDIRLPAMQADVFRVAYTLRCGGLWVDTATTCLAPLATWLDRTAPMVLLRRPKMAPPLVWNGFIYARHPQHPFLAEVWEEIARVILGRCGTGIWKLVGPGLYRDLLGAGHYGEEVRVLAVADLHEQLHLGSSGDVFPPEQHWSKRQRLESLYFSVPRTSADC